MNTFYMLLINMSEASSCFPSTPAKIAIYLIFILVALASGYFYGIEDSIADNVNTSTVTIAGVQVIDKSDYKGASYVLTLAFLLMYLYVVTQSDNEQMVLKILIPLIVGAGSWIIGIFFGHMNSINDHKELFGPALGCLIVALLIILGIVVIKVKGGARVILVGVVAVLLSVSSIMLALVNTADVKRTKFDNTRYGLYATTAVCLLIFAKLWYNYSSKNMPGVKDDPNAESAFDESSVASGRESPQL